MIIGTAGHVDHGKTTLIKALTGIDTDRLKEERERGLSIELGFAYLDLPSGRRAGVVDVPGHERFVHHMLAGAGGMDLVIMVIAADEGVMPQTQEHLEILQLLAVKRGLIALTKVDLVEREWLGLVTQEVGERVRGTLLESAPIIPVSGVTGQGVDELICAVDELLGSIEERDLSAPFRLPIDRVFTIAGFGTVVTGTLASGVIHVGDRVEIMPEQREARVRGVQTHGQAASEARAGQRVAVNLTGVELAEVERGQVLAPPGLFEPTSMLDVRLYLLPSAPRPLKHAARVRVHLGTAELIGRVMLLESDELSPAADGLAQVRLEHPTVAARGDRLVIRSYSPARTIAGALVLDPYPAKHRRRDQHLADELAFAELASGDELIEQAARDAAGLVLNRPETAKRLGLSEQALEERINTLAASGVLTRLLPEDFVVHAERWRELQDQIVAGLEAYHREHPLVPGATADELRGQMSLRVEPRVWQRALADLAAAGRIGKRGDRWQAAGFEVKFSPEQQRIAEQIERAFRDAMFAAPTLEEVLARFGDRKQAEGIANLLLQSGTLVQVEDLVLHQLALQRAQQVVIEYITTNGQMTAAQFRTLIGSSRKYAVPILEYLDSIGVTRRVGDTRVLVSPPEAGKC